MTESEARQASFYFPFRDATLSKKWDVHIQPSPILTRLSSRRLSRRVLNLTVYAPTRVVTRYLCIGAPRDVVNPMVIIFFLMDILWSSFLHCHHRFRTKWLGHRASFPFWPFRRVYLQILVTFCHGWQTCRCMALSKFARALHTKCRL